MKDQTEWLAAGIAAVILFASFTGVYFATQSGSGAQKIIRVACVGDSITHDTGYPDKLGTLLGSNYTVGNFGVGRTTVSLNFNKPYMKQQAFQDTLSFEPDIVVIMLGTNDAYLSEDQRSNFTSDYETLVNSIIADPSSDPQIYLCLPPPVFNNTMGLNDTILENEVIPLINQTAIDLNLPLIDVHSPLVNCSDAFQDGVHPNDQGADIVANQIYDAIAG
jgi:lysophospholipase L1-like esterase